MRCDEEREMHEAITMPARDEVGRNHVRARQSFVRAEHQRSCRTVSQGIET